MSYVTVGHCPKCGAPIYAPSLWGSILPPPSTHSCNCFSQVKTIVSTDKEELKDALAINRIKLAEINKRYGIKP